MTTGYEDYVTLEDSDPTTALAHARLHLQALMEKKRPRVGDAGASHDSSTLDRDIDRAIEFIERVRAVVNSIGVPQYVPCRRTN